MLREYEDKWHHHLVVSFNKHVRSLFHRINIFHVSYGVVQWPLSASAPAPGTDVDFLYTSWHCLSTCFRFMLLYVCRLFCVSVSLRCFPRNVSYYRCQNESRELTFIVSLVISCWVENEMSHREVDLSIDLLVKKLLLWPLVTVCQHAGQSVMHF